jgi:AbiV family abortive infection protein
MNESLSEGFLLQGAFYAMEQAGHLLYDSILLFNRGRYASSLALASYSLEEMGRARLIMGNIFQVREGGIVTGRSLDRELKYGKRAGAHLRKLKRGQRSVSLWQLCELLTAQAGPQGSKGPSHSRQVSSSVEHSEGISQLKEEVAAKIFDMRMRALYVDRAVDALRWHRPVEVSRDEAFDLLKRVSRDYRGDREGFRRLQKRIERSNKCGYSDWSVRPNLPSAIFPRKGTGPVHGGTDV